VDGKTKSAPVLHASMRVLAECDWEEIVLSKQSMHIRSLHSLDVAISVIASPAGVSTDHLCAGISGDPAVAD
jgi:hypothetical protein